MSAELIATWIGTGITLIGGWIGFTNKVSKLEVKVDNNKKDIDRVEGDTKEMVERVEGGYKDEVKKLYDELHFHNSENEKAFTRLENTLRDVTSKLDQLIGYNKAMTEFNKAIQDFKTKK
jgi:GTP1/Obg family GTP-binding protein